MRPLSSAGAAVSRLPENDDGGFFLDLGGIQKLHQILHGNGGKCTGKGSFVQHDLRFLDEDG